MLTIENLQKIQGRKVIGDWVVKECALLSHNNCYYFGLYNVQPFGNTDRCTVMLERKAIPHRSTAHPNELAYFFICDSQRTNYCATVDWLSNMDNMLSMMGELVKNEHIKL